MKKIMFNDAYGLTQATIDGWKTNTRRAEFSDEVQQLLTDADEVYMDAEDVVAVFDTACENVRLSTRYKVGEVVAVAQRYETIARQHPDVDYFFEQIAKADGVDACEVRQLAGYRNKMFTKAELMPHRIRITGIRAERLQDISDEDCIKEGIYKDECNTYFNGYAFELEHLEKGLVLAKRWYDTPRQAFATLIDKVSGHGTWESNPWVVSYEYELVK